MQINIEENKLFLSEQLRHHVRHRLRSTLSCYSGYISQVIIRLSAKHNLLGKDDMCCHIRIHLVKLPDIVVNDIETDIILAIDRAIDRAGRTVMRKLASQTGSK